MFFYILNIFLSAFLLFQIQPMIARYILPWFGGTPAVWSTVQMYFQVLLTGGYAYANWMIGRKRKARREQIHVVLLVLALVQVIVLGFLWDSPITPGLSWRPQGISFPIWEVFKLLTVSVGPAYFLLSTNSPIMQAWFNRAYPTKSPYILYALSNAGSLIALITYPILVEPRLTLVGQGWMWSGGFILFALFTCFGAIRSLRSQQQDDTIAVVTSEIAPTPDSQVQILWLALSACASILLLATTSHITQEVAVVPFLWVLPLTVYLLTFIIAFSDEKWYPRQAVFIAFYIATLLFAFALVRGPNLGVPLQVTIYTTTLFLAALACHGEIFRLRPHPSHLTRFYLMVSIGGALGGIFVNLVAPLIFKGFWELPLGILFAWGLIMYLRIRQGPAAGRAFWRRNRLSISIGGLVALGIVAVVFVILSRGILFVERNFYGLVRVDKAILPTTGQAVYKMVHGITVHGVQFIDPALKNIPTAYFSQKSGVGLAILNHPQHGKGMNVGVVGMGIGVLAAYSQPGDAYRLYEINPVAIRLAKGEGGYFSFLQDSPAKIVVIPGDGRISLEQELQTTGSNQFDILILDAFSSDSVPVHLIDKESFEIYLNHLKSDGILAMNVTNNYLDLRPVAWQLAQFYGLKMVYITKPGDGLSSYASQWILMSRNPSILDIPAIKSQVSGLEDFNKNLPLWTDNYSNLFQVLK
ncbi:MAG: fused MFS/spermidine synthase [Chloroflexota bacterium]